MTSDQARSVIALIDAIREYEAAEGTRIGCEKEIKSLLEKAGSAYCDYLKAGTSAQEVDHDQRD